MPQSSRKIELETVQANAIAKSDLTSGIYAVVSPLKPAARPRGFAAMSEEQRRALGRKGGKTAHERGTANKFTSVSGRDAGRVPHENGTAHKWTAEEAREAGRKGGKSARKPRQAALSIPSAPVVNADSSATPSAAR